MLQTNVPVSVTSASLRHTLLSISFPSHIIFFLSSSPACLAPKSIRNSRSHLTLSKRIPPRFSTVIPPLLLCPFLDRFFSLFRLSSPGFFSPSIIHLYSLCSSPKCFTDCLITLSRRSPLSFTLDQHHLLYHSFSHIPSLRFALSTSEILLHFRGLSDRPFAVIISKARHRSHESIFLQDFGVLPLSRRTKGNWRGSKKEASAGRY